MTVFLGCGTGFTAEMILKDHSARISYFHCVDISSTMVHLTKQRFLGLKYKKIGLEFKTDELNILAENALSSEAEKNSFDIIFSTFVFDAICNEDIVRIMNKVERLLTPGGVFGLVNLTRGDGFLARINTSLWEAMYKLSPKR